jgi:hypothetical protein
MRTCNPAIRKSILVIILRRFGGPERKMRRKHDQICASFELLFTEVLSRVRRVTRIRILTTIATATIRVPISIRCGAFRGETDSITLKDSKLK